MQKAIILHSKELSLMKSVRNADYSSKTVLTDSCWEYVELWLKRQGSKESKEALFYWQQAKYFFQASVHLPHNSKPLTSYYCCLNAAKALLCINKVDVNVISHGITQDRHAISGDVSLDKAEVIFLGSGVLNELSRYFDEDVTKHSISIKDLLYNIPCVHRTYVITYSSATELFIPINKLKFIRDDISSKAWIQFSVESRYVNALKYAPKHYKRIPNNDSNECVMRKENSRFQWDIHSPITERLNLLSNYHSKVRKDVHYIYGDKKLWYLKKSISGNKHIIDRNSPTLIFAVMHWLSELVRYNPAKFDKYMRSKQNWLLHEFIEKALHQFIDEISCEITHQDIMSTGFRC